MCKKSDIKHAASVAPDTTKLLGRLTAPDRDREFVLMPPTAIKVERHWKTGKGLDPSHFCSEMLIKSEK